jgi:hypothetical protein
VSKINNERFACVVLTELLFAALPILTVFLILFFKGDASKFLDKPELAVACAVLIGQGIAKFAAASASSQRNKTNVIRLDVIPLIIAIATVLGLVPTLVVLALMLYVESPSESLKIAQATFSIWDIALYVFMLVLSSTIRPNDDASAEK